MANEVDYDAPIFEAPDGSLFIKGPDAGEDNFDLKPTGLTLREVQRRAQKRITDEPSLSKTAAQALLGLEEGATVAMPRAIGGGFEFAGGLLPDATGGAALRRIGREAREGAGQIGKEYEDLSEGVGGGEVAKFTRGLGSSVVPSASALLAAAPLGLPSLGLGAGTVVTGSAVASGLQSLGGTFADAFEANKKRGMSDEEAYRRSYTPAVLSGLVTGLVTKGFGGTGLEPILVGKAVPKGFAAAVKEVAKDVGMEAVEEATDEAWQAVIRNTTFNPEATAEENLKGILQAGIAGGLMAGAVRGGQSAPSAISDLVSKKSTAAPTPPPLPAQPAPVAPAAPTVVPPLATRPTPAPVAPPVAPIQRAAPPTPTTRIATAPVPQAAPAAVPAQAVPPAVFPPIAPTRKDAQRVAADEPVSIKPTEPLPPNEARMVSAGAKILAKQGFDPETAAEFAEHFVRGLRGEPASMEVFRAELVNSANQIGLVNPNTARTKNTSVEGLVGSGVPRERAEQVARENALFNEARARQVTLSNREILKRIPRIYPTKRVEAAPPATLATREPNVATPKPRRVAITPEAQAAAPKRQQGLPEAPPLPEPLEGQPYDTRLETRPEAAMQTRPAPEMQLQRGPVISPELADAVEAVRAGYNPEVESGKSLAQSATEVKPSPAVKISSVPQEAWEIWAENLASDLDSFHPARDGGRDYDLIDAAQNFFDKARIEGGKTVWEAWTDFKADYQGPQTHLRKIQTSLTEAGFKPSRKKSFPPPSAPADLGAGAASPRPSSASKPSPQTTTGSSAPVPQTAQAETQPTYATQKQAPVEVLRNQPPGTPAQVAEGKPGEVSEAAREGAKEAPEQARVEPDVAALQAKRDAIEKQRRAEDSKPRKRGLRSALAVQLQNQVAELDARIREAKAVESISEPDLGEQQVLDEISKLRSVTGPLSQSERIDLNELRLSAQNKKLSRLSQAYLENLEERAAQAEAGGAQFSYDIKWLESLAKKYGAPPSPLAPDVSPSDRAMRASNMLERAADRSTDSDELSKILAAASGMPDESRISWAVANNPNTSEATFAEATRNRAMLAMASDEAVASLAPRRAQLRAQRELATPQRDKSKPEQMTPAEHRAARWLEAQSDDVRRGFNPLSAEDGKRFKPSSYYAVEEASDAQQKSATESAVELELPVSTAAVDTYGIKLPPGYVREGELYVWRGERPAELQEQAAPPAQDSPIAKPVETAAQQRTQEQAMKPRDQKKFLLEEIDRAIDEAPEGYDFDGTTMAPYLATAASVTPNENGMTMQQLKAANPERAEQLRKAAAETGADRLMERGEYIITEGSTIYAIANAINASATEKAYAEMPHVTISVPGDGVFSIINNKAALTKFKERAQKFPTTLPKAKTPSTPSGEPTSVPALGKPTEENALRAARLTTSDDETRKVLHYVWSDGAKMVGANGRVLLEISQPSKKGTKAKQVVINESGKTDSAENGFGDGRFPNWQQVVPAESILRFKGLDIGKLWNVLVQAKEATSEREKSVKLVLNQDGSLGVSASSVDEVSYSHNIHPGAPKAVTAVDPQYVLDILKASRWMGGEKVDISFSDELAPMVFESGKVRGVLMPMRIASLGSTPSARPAPSLSKMQVEQAVRELFDGNTPPNFQVTHNYGKTFNNREVRGWYDPATGTIWLNAAYLRSPQEARAVFVEEAFHAIQNDKSVQAELSRLVASLTPEQIASAQAAYGNISEEQLRMEAVADILERQQLTQEQRGLLARLWDAVLGAVQRLYGKFTGKVFTERDAQDVLAKALKAAAAGKRSNVGGQTIYAANAVVVPPNRRPDSFSLTAHHGTPHQVDKFSTAKIGTGEGAQVYGWGLYFAENPKVAEEYQKNLGYKGRYKYDGQEVDSISPRGIAIHILRDVGGKVKAAVEEVTRLYAVSEPSGLKRADIIREINSLDLSKVGDRANLYTVTLNVEPEDLLDWDKPLSEQSEKVRKALAAAADKRPNMTGAELYNVFAGAGRLVQHTNSDFAFAKEASKHLASLGIKGIRYLDQGSRGTTGGEIIRVWQENGKWLARVRVANRGGVGFTDSATVFTTSKPYDTESEARRWAEESTRQGTYNYVIFNEDDIRITHQNGQRISAAEAQEEQSLGSPQNQLDQQYFEAIQRGDMQEVQRLVEEAARGAGYNTFPMFHGTDANFTEFKYGGGKLGQGFYFASTPSQAREYGRKVMRVFLREGSLLREGDISDGGFPDPEEDGYAFRDAVENAGYTGVDGFEETVVYSPSQIKSADPITYDDSGNIIPLSQRFQQESPDIRYSLGERVQGPQEDNLGAKYTDAIRASESSGSRQDFLRGTDAEIEAAIVGANDAAVVRQGVGYEGRPSGAVRGLRSGTESAAGKAVPKVRVFISTDALDSTARKNSEILASRIFPAESGTQAAALSDMDEGDFVLTAARRTPFFVTIFSAEGEKSPLARTQTLADGTPAIIFNTTNLGKFNLQDAATAAQFDGVLSEELIHVAAISVTSQKEAQDVWASLSDKEKKAAERSYNRRRNKDALSDYELGHEYLRMVIQERMFGKTTEQVELRITEPVKKFLRKLLNFIKEAFGKKPENDIARQLVSRIESALNGEMPRRSSIIPSGTSLATNISQSDATEVQGRAIEPSLIAAASRSVADLGRQQFEEFEQAGRQLEGLAYESKQFRQARSELNNLVSLHEGRLRQLPQDRVTDDMRANIRDGVSIENGQIVVGDELVTKLAQMGVQTRPELVRAMQAEVYFEQQARRLVDNLGKLATLKELKDYYTRIKAPADEILNLDKLIAAKEKVVANLTPVTINRGNDQQSVGERASEITRANASKVELQAKRDALNLEPVQEFFGKGITELRDLSERAKAAADLTRALMDSTTSISEVARLGEIYDKWAGFDATVKDALKKGTLTDEQRVSVLTSLQQSFNEFDEAKFRMDDLLGSEEQGLLKSIRQAEADIADAKVKEGMAEILIKDALKAAKGEMGLTGTVGDAARIENVEKLTDAITTLAMNLGRTIDQNRWLYDFLMAPGAMPAFGANIQQSLFVTDTALREILKVVQQSPSLASAIVTLTDDAAAKLAASPPNQMQSIAQLATSGNPQGMALAANLTSQIVQQANAQGTKANAARQTAARQLAQSVLRLRTLQQGQALFNQTANSPAFQQLRSAVAAGASEAQKMVVLGPTGPVLRGFKSAAKEYQPELKIDVDGSPLELSKTREKVWKYLQNAEQYVADYEAAAAAYAANPANPSPSQLGFDVADYNGLKFAIENQIVPMFLNMGDMDDAARAAQYLTPVLVRKFMKLPAFLGQIFLQYEQLGKMVGGFAGNTFRQQIAKYKRGYLNAKRVASQFQDLPRLQSAAMQSHNIKNEDTYRKIFNEMAHYGRLFGTPLRVGFKLPVSNQVVTKADMEFLKRTLAFEEKLRREVTEVDPVTGVRYMRGGKEVTRKGAYVGDIGMPRHLNRGATRFIADVTNAYAGTPKGFTPATDLSASSQDEAVKYWNENLGTLKQHILDSLRTDRSLKQSAEMAAAEKKIAARWLAGNMNQVSSVQDLVDLIAAEIPATSGKNPLDTAREGLNNELLQYVAHAERIKKERAEDNAKTSGLSIALSSENEYTKPAAYLELPSEYYDYGAVSSVDRITAQARANHSTLIDFANSIRLAITELRNRLDRLKLATTDKERDLILENYKGNQQEMEDVLELLTASLKNFEDSYRAGGPDIVPTRLGQKVLKAAVGSVLAKLEIAIRNLSQGQLQVFTNLRAMNYMSARLAAWKALSNVPRGLVNTGYLVARNIAGFTDRRLGRDPQFQRTLKGAVDVLADVIFKSAQLALLKPRIGAANVRASFERVNSLGFDTSNDWWETAMQAWNESGQFRNQLEEDNATKNSARMALHFLDRLANTGLDSINAFVRGSVLESSDTNMNALSLGLVGNMEKRLEEVAMVFGKRLTDLGITRIDPTDKRAVLQANEWLPSLNQQTATNSLGEIRKFLESSASSEGFSLEQNLLKYYQDKMAGRPAEIFNQRTFDAVQRSMIAENNAALPTNRASAGQASTLWRTLLTLQGYPADAFLKLLRITTGGSRERTKVLQAASKISLALGIAAMAILLQGSGDAGSELAKRKLQGKKPDRVTPLDSEFWSDPEHMKRALGRYIMMSAYYLGNAMEAAYGWVDGRTTIDPTQRVFAIATASQIIRDITSGAKIAAKGGSVSEALEPLRRSIIRLTFAAPELEYLLGKERDSAEGARRAMTENAKAQGIELPSPGFTGTVGLTNIKRKALSQAVSDMDIAKRKGDTEGYNKAKAAAQKQISELEAYYLKQRLDAGDSPEVAAKTAKASVWGDYQENNPVTAALGGKRPTAEQYKQLVGDPTTERGQSIRQGIKAWQDGAQALFGKPGNLTKEDVAENRPRGTVREPSYGRVSLTGGVSSRMQSVGPRSSRGRWPKIRRVSLTGRRRRISPLRSRRRKIRRVSLIA